MIQLASFCRQRLSVILVIFFSDSKIVSMASLLSLNYHFSVHYSFFHFHIIFLRAFAVVAFVPTSPPTTTTCVLVMGIGPYAVRYYTAVTSGHDKIETRRFELM